MVFYGIGKVRNMRIYLYILYIIHEDKEKCFIIDSNKMLWGHLWGGMVNKGCIFPLVLLLVVTNSTLAVPVLCFEL